MDNSIVKLWEEYVNLNDNDRIIIFPYDEPTKILDGNWNIIKEVSTIDELISFLKEEIKGKQNG